VGFVTARAQLAVKVLTVRAGAHGGAEDGLDEEAVVGLEGDAVGAAERVGELLGRLGHILAEGDAGELETSAEGQVSMVACLLGCWGVGGASPNQPCQALSGDVGLSLELVPDEILDVVGLEGGREVTLSEFLGTSGQLRLGTHEKGQWALHPYLDVAQHVLLDGGEGDGAEEIWLALLALGRSEETEKGASRVPNMVVRDSAASRNSSVEIALSAPTGTLLKVRFMDCRWVWVAPAGICATAAMVVLCGSSGTWYLGVSWKRSTRGQLGVDG
jgi:hypothetical protein